MKYRIEVKKSVLKVLERIPRFDQIRISQAIQNLADNPRPRDCVKLTGTDYYRIRCGIYRIIYAVLDGCLIVVILKVGHRKDIYR